MKTPIEILLDQVEWIECFTPGPHGTLPYVTHKGIFTIGEIRLRCYVLSDGRRIFDATDVKELFGL